MRKKTYLKKTLPLGVATTLASALGTTTAFADEFRMQEIKTIDNEAKKLEVKIEQLDKTLSQKEDKVEVAKAGLLDLLSQKEIGHEEATLNADLEALAEQKDNEKRLEAFKVELENLKSKQKKLEKLEAAEIKAQNEAQKAAQEEAKKTQEVKQAEEDKQAKDSQEVKELSQLSQVEETTSTATISQAGSLVTGSKSTIINETANSYPWGQCTWGVKNLAPWAGNYWGNAGQWAVSAAAEGFEIGSEPRPGAIAVWPHEAGGYGHVAYVTDVESSSRIKVLESNYNGIQTIQDFRGWFNPQLDYILYIYPKN